MSSKTIRDAAILIHNLLTTQIETEVLQTLMETIVQTYTNNSYIIGTMEELTCKLDVNLSENLSENDNNQTSQFELLLQHLISEKQEKIRPFLIHLLNKPPFKEESILSKIITVMEDSFFTGLPCRLRKIIAFPSSSHQQSPTMESSNSSINLTMKTTPDKFNVSSRYFVTISLFSTALLLDERLSTLKPYQGLCSTYCFKRRATSATEFTELFLPEKFLGDEIATKILDKLKLSPAPLLITISPRHAISLKKWIQLTMSNRRIVTEEQVRLQVQVVQGLLRQLAKFLEKKLTTINFIPKNFFFMKIGRKRRTYLPTSFGFRPQNEIPDFINCSDFDKLFISSGEDDNAPNIRFSVGRLMILALSGCPEEEFENMLSLFDEDSHKLEEMHRLSPILSTSKTLRSLIRMILDPSISNEELLARVKVDWDGLFRDFEMKGHTMLLDSEDNDAAFMKLAMGGVENTVIEEFKDELISMDFPHIQILDRMTKDKYSVVDEELLEMGDWKELVEFVINERQWMFSPFMYNSRTFLPSPFIENFFKRINTLWDQEMTNLSFFGENKFGFLLQNEITTSKQDKILYLIPKPRIPVVDKLRRIKQQTYGKLTAEIEVTDYKHFYDVLARKVIHADDLLKLIPSCNNFPGGLQSILNSGICLEMLCIQFHVDRPSVQDCIETGTVTLPFMKEIIKNLILELGEVQMEGIIVPELRPESIYFLPVHKEGDERFKLPVNIKDASLISRNEGSSTSTTMESNICQLGIIIIKLLLSATMTPVKIEPDEPWESILDRLVCQELHNSGTDLMSAIRKMITTNIELQMNSSDFKMLQIPSIGLRSGAELDLYSVEQKHLHILGLLADDEVGIQVIKEVKDDLRQLEDDGQIQPELDCTRLMDEMLEILNAIGNTEGYEELQNRREKFASVTDFCNGYLEEELFHSQAFFSYLLYKSKLYNNVKFREKVFETIQKVWMGRFENMQPIGNGAFGLVFKATDKMNNGGLCAVKFVIPKDPKQEVYAMQEVKAMEAMNHPNIIKSAEFVEEIKFTELELRKIFKFNTVVPLRMVESDFDAVPQNLEVLMQKLIVRSRNAPVKGWLINMNLAGANLREWLDETMEQRKKPDDSMGKKQFEIIRELLRAMKYLQARGTMHSDLKPDNILFDRNISDEKYSFPVQIADLGLSRELSNISNDDEVLSRRGNRRYQAPEIMSGGPITLNAEIYSIAVIILEILKPVESETTVQLGQLVTKFRNHAASLNAEGVDDEITRLVKSLYKMVQTDPSQRMNYEEFQGLDFDWSNLYNFHACDIQKGEWALMK